MGLKIIIRLSGIFPTAVKSRLYDGRSVQMRSLSIIPNTITFFRIIGTAALIFVAPFTAVFYVIYTICGITDILDGALARALKCKSELGARLDSIADLLFYAVMIVKILPELIKLLPVILWVVIALTVLLRIASYTLAAVKYKRFASMHTYLNKLSGAAIFIVPYFVKLPSALPICITVTAIAVLAAIEEFSIHLSQKNYRKDIKTVLDIIR